MSGAPQALQAGDRHLLARTALEQEALSGLCKVLQVIAQTHNADGCILWEAASGGKVEARRGFFFTLAQWFSEEPLPRMRFDLPFEGTVTGEAVAAGVPIFVKDCATDPRIDTNRAFYMSYRPSAMCSIPVKFVDGAVGALNLYRKGRRPFTDLEITDAQHDAHLVPELYAAIRNRVSFRLMSWIGGILDSAELEPPPLPLAKVREFMQKVCDAVSDTFQCLETSVFLEDPFEAPGQYVMFGTTWQDPVNRSVYTRDDQTRTGWVLKHGKGIKLFDLANLNLGRDSILQEYPGVSCETPNDFIRRSGELLKFGPEDPLPPFSFVAAPLLIGNKVLGAIRCCAANRPPYYFASRELQLLSMVASRLAQFWSTWIRQREIQEENNSWLALIDSVGEMNSFVHHEFSLKPSSEILVWEKGLEIVKAAVKGAEILDVRVRDAQTNELYYAATYGDAWRQGTPDENRMRLERRFRLSSSDPATSIGSLVYHTGKPCLVEDVFNDPHYDRSAAFPGVKRIIVAPIRSETEVFGVLDVQSTSPRPFPRHALAAADLLGKQLGLYHYLSLTLAELQKVPQVYEDLGHQLKTPVRQAYARIQSLVETRLSLPMQESANAIQALLLKSVRVVNNTRFFAELAHTGKIKSQQFPVDYTRIMSILERACSDNQLMVPPDRKIKFRVERGSFADLRALELRLDEDLFVRAIDCVLDNAAKYSFQDTVVHVTGGLGKDRDRFYIAVQNTGLRLSVEEAKLARTRRWRSDEAQVTTGEGSGIGLWIVDHILQAHRGELEILPTSRFGITDVRLVFPCFRKK